MDGDSIYVHLPGAPEGREFSRPFTVGRDPGNEIVLDDTLISTHHLRVEPTDRGWQARDMGTTNGTYQGGRRVTVVLLDRETELRLAHPDGPALRFVPAARPADGTAFAVDADQRRARRYLSQAPPEDMSDHTAMVRQIITEQRRHAASKPRIVAAVVTLLAIATGAFALWQRGQIRAQRAAASDMFYLIRGLELQIGELAVDTEDRASLEEQQEALERRYRQMVEDLGIYDESTPPETRLIYDVVRRFGESELDVPPGFIDEVERFIDRWRENPPLDALERAEARGYGPRIAAIMMDNGLPPEFFYLAMQESGLDPDAIGPETRFGYAKGMWQFIPGTAREYGLQIGPMAGLPVQDSLDGRHDFEASTRAAARYLRRLYMTDAQASGLLVVAAYNWGPTNVIRLLRQLPETPRDRNFWRVLTEYRDRIPDETYDYVFRIIAAAVIGERPELFGFEFGDPLAGVRPGEGEEARIGEGPGDPARVGP